MFNVLNRGLKGISPRAIHDAKVSSQWPEEPLDLPVGRKGGFYPAALGEKLNLTYTIVRKLGWGQHSNVWLAQREGCVTIMSFIWAGCDILFPTLKRTWATVRRCQSTDGPCNASATPALR
jgi:hypothetical protein